MESIAAKIFLGQSVLPHPALLRRMAFLLADSILHQSKEPSGKTCRCLQDRKADQLLDLYGNSILRLAYSYLHNMSDAEDILQDTMIRYLKNRPTFENASCEKAWLMRVAANLCKNKIKYHAIRAADEPDDNLRAAEKQDLSFVWHAVKQLPVKQLEAIHL